MTEPTKRCPACGKDRPLSEWGRNRTNADGLQGNCTPCRRARRAANIEAVRAADRAYAAEHRQEARERAARWRQANRDRARSRDAEYYRRNKHRWLARRAAIAGAAGVATAEQIEARVVYFGGRCWVCGDPWEQIDHVKPLKKGGSHWPANLRPICGPCNEQKQAKWPVPLSVAGRERVGVAH